MCLCGLAQLSARREADMFKLWWKISHHHEMRSQDAVCLLAWLTRSHIQYSISSDWAFLFLSTIPLLDRLPTRPTRHYTHIPT